MGLKLADVYNMRNGILAFTENLEDNIQNATYETNNGAVNQFFNCISVKVVPPIEQKDKESDEDYKKRLKPYGRTMRQQLDSFTSGARKIMAGKRNEAAFHRVALDAFSLLAGKQKELEEANPGKLDNLIITEFRKNVELFEARLLKMGIPSYEIYAARTGDPKLKEKTTRALLENGFSKSLTDLGARYKVNFKLSDPRAEEAIKDSLNQVVDWDNLKRMQSGGLNENTKEFYGLLKNAGYTYTRDFNTGYYDMPLTVEKTPAGYKLAEDGTFVEKESTGFFSSIVNFFGRLANHGMVNEYNAKLAASLQAFDNEKAEKEITEMEAMMDGKKKIIIEELSKETGMSAAEKDFEATEMYKMRKEMREEMQDAPVTVGPGLDQID